MTRNSCRVLALALAVASSTAWGGEPASTESRRAFWNAGETLRNPFKRGEPAADAQRATYQQPLPTAAAAKPKPKPADARLRAPKRQSRTVSQYMAQERP